MRSNSLLTDWIRIALLATALVAGLGLSSLTTPADNLLYDHLLATQAAPPSDKIIIIAIDNRSLQTLGKWPWPRSTHTRLLNQLAAAHPQAIAYDVLFTEPADADDEALASALHAARPVYIPLLFDSAGATARQINIIPPVPALAQSAAAVAQANVNTDTDGLVRRADLTIDMGDHIWPHMMCLMADCRGFATPLPIAYQPQTGAFRTASFVDVMNGQVPPIFFHNKLVLVGATGDGLGDQFSVPIRGGGQMPGIELQANLLNTLLNNTHIRILPHWGVALISMVPLWILLLGFWRWRPRTTLYAALFIVSGWLALCAGLFAVLGWWIAPMPALIGLVLIYPLWGWRRLVAISSGVEQSIGLLDEQMPTQSPRFAQSDRVETQISALGNAVQASRKQQKNAQEREESLQMLSHDMRAPQASIITLLETERKQIGGALAERLSGYARRTLALADNFVQLARIDAAPFAPEEVNLCDCLQGGIDELWPLLKARKLRMVTDGLDEPHYIMAEPALLVRVFINLLDNAIKYSPEGGEISCNVVRNANHVIASIADQGQGMDEAQQAALFNRFSPVGSQRHTGSAGSGLGLALVKAAVDRHGGRIECESALGAGTRFSLSFEAVD